MEKKVSSRPNWRYYLNLSVQKFYRLKSLLKKKLPVIRHLRYFDVIYHALIRKKEGNSSNYDRLIDFLPCRNPIGDNTRFQYSYFIEYFVMVASCDALRKHYSIITDMENSLEIIYQTAPSNCLNWTLTLPEGCNGAFCQPLPRRKYNIVGLLDMGVPMEASRICLPLVSLNSQSHQYFRKFFT